MLVYRVEHRDSRLGPYATPAPVGLRDREANATDRQPLHDRHPASERTWRYGFRTEYQLSQWFSAEQRGRLTQQGFVLSVYEADSCRVVEDTRGTQVVFAEAERVREVNLSPGEEQHGAEEGRKGNDAPGV